MPTFRIHYSFAAPEDGHPHAIVVGAHTLEAEDEKDACVQLGHHIKVQNLCITSVKELS